MANQFDWFEHFCLRAPSKGYIPTSLPGDTKWRLKKFWQIIWTSSIQALPTHASSAEFTVFSVQFFLDTQLFAHNFMQARQAISICVQIRAETSCDSAANPKGFWVFVKHKSLELGNNLNI